MLARRKGLALLCAGALLSTAAIATNSGTAFAAPRKAPAKAAPASPVNDAKTAFNDGKDKFDAGDYAGALVDFQKANQLYPGAAPKHRIALCLDKLGRAREAIAAYRTFIDSQPGEKYEDRVAESNARVAELEATLPAVVKVTVIPPDAPGIQLAVDGKAVDGMQLELPAGEHTVVVSAEGYQPLTEQITVKGAEERELALTLTAGQTAPPPPPPPVEEDEDGGSNIPAYVTLGIAGAGVILGTIFGIQALGAKGDFEDEPTTENADAAERDALIADMSFGVALTFGITGIVLLFTGGENEEEAGMEPEQTARPVLTPYGGPKGGGMAATWSF